MNISRKQSLFLQEKKCKTKQSTTTLTKKIQNKLELFFFFSKKSREERVPISANVFELTVKGFRIPHALWPHASPGLPFGLTCYLIFPSLSFPSLPIRLPRMPSFFLLVHQISSFEGYIYFFKKHRWFISNTLSMKCTLLLQASQIKLITLRLTQLFLIVWLIFWTGTYILNISMY